MNTGFIHRCKLLVSNRSRVLAIGQTLCLLAVAAIFFVAPFVALAGCKTKNGTGTVNSIVKNFTGLAAVSQVSPGAAPNALNLSFIPKSIVAVDSMTLHPVTAADLVPGHWITVAEKNKAGVTEVFQASVFTIAQLGGQNVVELWVAELPGNGTNPLNLKIGQKIFNISEAALLAGK